MINSTEKAVDFLGHQINCVHDADRNPYVPLKWLCEVLGIDHNPQERELKDRRAFDWSDMYVKGADGRYGIMLCLALEVVGDWASTIDPTTVRPELVEALTEYLDKSKQALERCKAQESTANPGMIEVTTEGRKLVLRWRFTFGGRAG
jgi:hypothetical protein